MFLSVLEVNTGSDPDQPQPGRRWLRDVYRVHQRLWMAFPDVKRRLEDPFFLGTWDGGGLPEPKPRRREGGFLFRIERDGRPRILVQSAARPDWEYAFQNAPHLLASAPRMREFDPAPRVGHAYRFRLLANVVRRKSFADPDGKTRMTRAGLTIARRKRAEFSLPAAKPPLEPAGDATQAQQGPSPWDAWRAWISGFGVKRGFRIVEENLSPLRMESVHVEVRAPRRAGDDGGKTIDRRFNAGLFNGVLVCTQEELLHKAIVDGIGGAKAFGFGLLSLARAGPDTPPPG